MGRKLASKLEMDQVRIALVMQFPNCFVPKGQKKTPLKIGISKDLFAAAREAFPGLSLRLLRSFIIDYVSGANYQRCMVSGRDRVDLFGNVVGQVTESAAAYHAGQLARINAIQNKRLSAKKAASPSGNGEAEPIGAVALRVVSDVRTKLDALNEKLKNMKAEQYRSEMANDSYYTDGSKRIDDENIYAVSQQIRELEASL